jgi:hypothetical protein
VSDGPPLWAELDRLIDRFGEAEVAAALDARRKRPRGRPPEEDRPYLLEMASIIALSEMASIIAPRPWKPTKRRGIFQQKISWTAKEVAPQIPRYDPAVRKDVAKTLRGKFNKALQISRIIHSKQPPEKKLSELATAIAIMQRLLFGQRHRWTPFSDLPEGVVRLAEVDEPDCLANDIWPLLVELTANQVKLAALHAELDELERTGANSLI